MRGSRTRENHASRQRPSCALTLGVDDDPGALACARENLNGAGGLLRADATNLPLAVASIDEADPLMPIYPEAQFVVRVRATQVFPNCPRYIHRLALVERSRFVPRAECETPVPGWKRTEWARDVLPEGDPARTA